MIGTTRKAVVLSLSAALILSGPIGAFAAPANGSAPKYISQVGESAGKNGVILVRKSRGRGSWKGNRGRSSGKFQNRGRSFGKFQNRGRSFGKFKNRGHRRNNRGLFVAPFLAAPFLYGGYYGYDPYYDYGYSGYDDTSDCYRECRYEHSRSYCRRYWHRYC